MWIPFLLVYMLSYFNLYQFNIIHNQNDVILDLALSNVHVICYDFDPLLPINKHHQALNISLNCNQFNVLSVDDIIYDLKNCDYTKIVKYIADSFPIYNFNNSFLPILLHLLIYY